VLVLEGKREISESFYIEPFTGQAYSLTTKEFHGIESIWNHQNYWVNMQLCKNGVVVSHQIVTRIKCYKLANIMF